MPRSSRTAPIAIAAVLIGILACCAAAFASPATRTVRYRGIALAVPRGWPVFHLGAQSTTCVRFNRHAVYLGEPGSEQICPRQPVGRTEAILVSPSRYRGALLTPVSRLTTSAATGSMARIPEPTHDAVITVTWLHRPALISRALGVGGRALGVRSLRDAMLASNGHPPMRARIPQAGGIAARRSHAYARAASPSSPARPGEVYAGLGFDVCSTPPARAMSAWGSSSPYGAIGIYIGGVNAACLGGNLTASWVSGESLAGWHMLPLYVGLQAPGGCCRAMSSALTGGQYATAASQGTAAAQDAIAQAQALGIGTGNPIYYDMENYTRSGAHSGAVLAFLQAWTVQLHSSGYLSGVYSSGSSGITDLAANWGTGYVEPDELWTAAWDATSPPTPPTSPVSAYVPVGDWACNDQLLQYYSDPSRSPETYGGVSIGIDRDYVDALTAAYGSTALVTLTGSASPSLLIKPAADGSVGLRPGAGCESGISSYTILAGPSPLALAQVDSVPATARFPVSLRAVFAYYEVEAVNSLGQVIGTSAPIQTPPGVAIFGNSAYVGARGPVGIPVACQNLKPCRLEAQIFDGRRRIAHSALVGISRHGGQLLVPLSTRSRSLVSAATGHRLPVTVTLTSSAGIRVSRPLELVGYTISGKAPKHRTWPSSVLRILASTSYVSNGWTGGVLAACLASVPCVSTVHVTLGGVALAAARTTTLGPGEIGYLTYTLDNRGHRLLRAQPGNQLGARITVSTDAPPAITAPPSTAPPSTGGPPPSSGGASIASAGRTTMALVSLVGFR